MICDECETVAHCTKHGCVPKQPAPAQEPVGLRDALARALTSTYVCGRVWDAWNVGTMTEDDFQPAAECDELLDELVSTIYTTPPAQPAPVPLTDEQILAANYPDGEENGATIAAPDFELIAFARDIEAKLKENT